MSNKGVSPVVIIAGLVGFLAIVGAYVYLIATNHDTSVVTGFLATTVVPLFLTLRNAKLSEETQAKVTTIEHRVNGPLSAAVQQIAAVHNAVVAANPVATPVAQQVAEIHDAVEGTTNG